MFSFPALLHRAFGRARTYPAHRIEGLDALEASTLATRPILESTRQYMFLRLREIAHRHELHVAPEVSLAAIFTVCADAPELGAEAVRALRNKRVDFLLIDGAANAVLAIDCPATGMTGARAMRDGIKLRAFEKACLPLLELMGGPTLDADMARVEDVLASRALHASAGGTADRRAA
ncbi:hypothetical protein JSE7799_00013 [Jannaschia seosinensis]|uniref:DUF2726 domain-containing protein n=1 Tax=Jannaschia seosinensis TaxID=313367 RepID=A0A0M7B5S8_9RHOB|nr:DUF2726 domain-containing protein [Jannaschia seosinensis]CUH07252.1 hypothetical protein JSE7799_00013 [Jannaschia seosinensis]